MATGRCTRAIRWLLVGAAIATLLSCATTSGTLLADIQETDAADTTKTADDPPKDGEAKPTKPEDTPKGLAIITQPSGALVREGLEILGTTPLDLTQLKPGSYHLTLEKEGYRTIEVWIDYDGKPATHVYHMEEITGFLHVATQPATASATVDGREVEAEGVRLRAGRYEVLVRAFGYVEQRIHASVAEDQLTSLTVVLEKAPFTFRSLEATRDAFSPLSYGNLGRTEIRFEVTAPGTARVEIRDPHDTVVLVEERTNLDTWDQRVTWSGRDRDGNVLPDGVYHVTLTGDDTEGAATQPRVLEIRIDTQAVIEYRSLISGSAGLAYVGTPETLPARAAQISALAIAHVSDGGATYRVPVALGFRLGLGGSWEMDLEAGTYLSSGTGPDSLPLFASVSGRHQLLRPRGRVGLGLAVGARAAYHTLSADTLTNFTGLGLQAPAGVALGPVSLLVSPELVVSYRRVDAPNEAAAFWIWGYARAGVMLSLGPLVAGLSTAVRLQPFQQGLGIQMPLPVAAEAHLILPGTSIVLSVMVSGEIDPDPARGHYFMAGGGFGVLN